MSVISATSDSDDVSESEESGKPIPSTCSVKTGLMMTLTSPFAAGHAYRVVQAGRAGQGRARRGRAGQGRAGQGRAGQGRAGQGRAEWGKARQGEAGHGRAANTALALVEPSGQ